MDATVSKSKLLDEIRKVLRREGYAYSTEHNYCDGVKRFVKFHDFHQRQDMLLNPAS